MRELPTMPPTEEAVRLARLQAIFYVATGVWPFVSMRTFEAVTGPKVDRWLVKTVGALVAVIGCALALASRRRQLAPEIVLVAAGSAAALATIDTVYVARRRISPSTYSTRLPRSDWSLPGRGSGPRAHVAPVSNETLF